MEITLKNRKIGDNHPLFFIAEAGVNHNGSMELAIQLVDAAADAGADAVKFQTFKTEKIIVPTAPKSTYHVETTGSQQSWYDLLKTQELTRAMHLELISHCNKQGILFLSTPYDEESATLLDELDVPAFKMASTDINNLPFLRFVARRGRPMILSTAMSTMEEVQTAADTIRSEGQNDLVILQCTGNYPARIENSHLNVIKRFRSQIQCLVGYSDHTLDLVNPIAATALGASIYEKHFTLDQSLPGPDHRMSLNPSELKRTITAIRQTESALGNDQKIVLPAEEENRVKLRKSLVAAIDIRKGDRLTRCAIAIKRPGNGLPPDCFDQMLGKTAIVDIPQNTLFEMAMFE